MTARKAQQAMRGHMRVKYKGSGEYRITAVTERVDDSGYWCYEAELRKMRMDGGLYKSVVYAELDEVSI